jgi:hypothetical protein
MGKIPIDDHAAFERWLRENPHYTDWDIAIETRKSLEVVRGLRLKLGVRRRPARKHKPEPPIDLSVYTEPPGGYWRDVAWFTDHFERLGIRKLARLLGRSRTTIGQYALKLNLKVPHRYNPCNRRDWLYELYVVQKHSVNSISKKANVCRRAIEIWMARHGIRPRIASQEHGAPVWWRKLTMSLRQLRFVKYKTRRSGILSVRFRSSKRDYYTYDERKRVDNYHSFILVESDIRLKRIPKIYSSTEGKVYDSLKNPLDFYISPIELMNSSLLERRILYHTLATIITSNGFYPLDYTYNEIVEDLPKYDSKNVDEYFGLQTVSLRPADVYRPGNGFKCMISCFVPPKAILLLFSRVDYLLHAMTKLEKIKNRPLNLCNLLLMAAQVKKSRMYEFMMPMPMHYYSVFKKLKVKGPILDLYPGLGAKFLAARALGIDYYTLSESAVNYASAQGIGQIIGAELKLYDGRPVEWLIYDNDMSVRDRELPVSLLQKTAHLMRFDRRNDFNASYKIPVSWNKYTGSAIYLAVD